MKKLLALLAACLLSAAASAATVNFTAASDTTNYPNPDRGIASWSGSDFVNNYDSASVTSAYSNGDRLVVAKLMLNSYRTVAIPSSYLTTLNTRFASLRSAGMKAVVWASYDDSNTGNDATAAQIKAHLEQLKDVFDANKDVIAYVKAGFVGAYGEWWGSENGNSCCFEVPAGTTAASAAANQVIIRDALLANIPKTVIVQYRYPTILMTWYGTVLAKANAYSGLPQSRTGFHNDCAMSTNDTGTWSSGSTGTSQKTYIQALNEYAPFGGEVANNCTNSGDGTNNTCTTLLSYMPLYRVTWWKNPNTASASNYYNAWTSGGCYTTFIGKMGYRITPTQLVTPTSITKGTTGTATLSIYNNGWSRMHQGRKLEVVLRRQGGSETVIGYTPSLQTLPSQSTTPVSWSIKIAVPSGQTSGTYDVLLRIPDQFSSNAYTRNFMVRPMVVDGSGVTWNNTTGELATGATVSIP